MFRVMQGSTEIFFGFRHFQKNVATFPRFVDHFRIFGDFHHFILGSIGTNDPAQQVTNHYRTNGPPSATWAASALSIRTCTDAVDVFTFSGAITVDGPI